MRFAGAILGGDTLENGIAEDVTALALGAVGRAALPAIGLDLHRFGVGHFLFHFVGLSSLGTRIDQALHDLVFRHLLGGESLLQEMMPQQEGKRARGQEGRDETEEKKRKKFFHVCLR